jgi:hypothetical protein
MIITATNKDHPDKTYVQLRTYFTIAQQSDAFCLGGTFSDPPHKMVTEYIGHDGIIKIKCESSNLDNIESIPYEHQRFTLTIKEPVGQNEQT